MPLKSPISQLLRCDFKMLPRFLFQQIASTPYQLMTGYWCWVCCVTHGDRYGGWGLEYGNGILTKKWWQRAVEMAQPLNARHPTKIIRNDSRAWREARCKSSQYRSPKLPCFCFPKNIPYCTPPLWCHRSLVITIPILLSGFTECCCLINWVVKEPDVCPLHSSVYLIPASDVHTETNQVPFIFQRFIE